MTESPEDIVGHKTFHTGERDALGLPVYRHEPLTRAERFAAEVREDQQLTTEEKP